MTRTAFSSTRLSRKGSSRFATISNRYQQGFCLPLFKKRWKVGPVASIHHAFNTYVVNNVQCLRLSFQMENSFQCLSQDLSLTETQGPTNHD